MSDDPMSLDFVFVVVVVIGCASVRRPHSLQQTVEDRLDSKEIQGEPELALKRGKLGPYPAVAHKLTRIKGQLALKLEPTE